MTVRRVGLAVTGASGSRYALTLLQALLRAEVEVHLTFSTAAQVVLATEEDLSLPGAIGDWEAAFRAHLDCASGQLQVWGEKDWFSPLASGSHAPDALVVCPCSGGTLAAIAQGLSNNLLERSADVMLKEGKPVILVPRETPVSAIHLENQLKLARLGVCILPASPGFYDRPETIQDLIDFVVGRILAQLGIASSLGPRWGAGPA